MAIIESHKATTATHTRFKVTKCLYRNPNTRARSLSILIAVSVNRDTPQKIRPKVL